MDQEYQDPQQCNHHHHLHDFPYHHLHLHLGKGVRQNLMLPSLATNLGEQSAEAGDLLLFCSEVAEHVVVVVVLLEDADHVVVVL